MTRKRWLFAIVSGIILVVTLLASLTIGKSEGQQEQSPTVRTTAHVGSKKAGPGAHLALPCHTLNKERDMTIKERMYALLVDSLVLLNRHTIRKDVAHHDCEHSRIQCDMLERQCDVPWSTLIIERRMRTT